MLFCGQRSREWPGLPVWDQFAYETEYYAFDPARPVIRLHIGRPLDGGMHFIDYSQSDEAKATFPLLGDSVRQDMADNIRKVVEALRPYGAKELPFRHPRIHAYLLPGGTKLTFRDFTSTGTRLGVPADRAGASDAAGLAAARSSAGVSRGAGLRCRHAGRTRRKDLHRHHSGRLPVGASRRSQGEDPGRAGTRWDGARCSRPIRMSRRRRLIPGSLREAVEADRPAHRSSLPSRGRLSSSRQLKIRNPYITIAGNTAPGEGVQIRNWGLEIMTHDVVLRYLRLRVGDIKGPGPMPRVLGDQTHALDLSGLNIVVDHCEFAYANDQIVNIYAQRTPESRAAVTFQWNYVYGGLTKSVHEGGNHSHAYALGGWGYASFHHNLAAFTLGRNPRISGLQLDYRNNVLHYFWDSGYGDSTDDFLKLNYIANVLEHGQRREAFFDGMHFQSGQFYAADNVVRNCKRKASSRVLDVPPEILMKAPFAAVPVQTQTAKKAYADVLHWGGAGLPTRDLITTYVAKCVHDDTGDVPGTTDDWPSAGYPVYQTAAPLPDSDRDGMPDEWETRYKLDPRVASDANQDADGDGYTNIEEYINGTDPTQYVDYRNPANNRDLRGP